VTPHLVGLKFSIDAFDSKLYAKWSVLHVGVCSQMSTAVNTVSTISWDFGRLGLNSAYRYALDRTRTQEALRGNGYAPAPGHACDDDEDDDDDVSWSISIVTGLRWITESVPTGFDRSS